MNCSHQFQPGHRIDQKSASDALLTPVRDRACKYLWEVMACGCGSEAQALLSALLELTTLEYNLESTPCQPGWVIYILVRGWPPLNEQADATRDCK